MDAVAAGRPEWPSDVVLGSKLAQIPCRPNQCLAVAAEDPDISMAGMRHPTAILPSAFDTAGGLLRRRHIHLAVQPLAATDNHNSCQPVVRLPAMATSRMPC